MKPIQLLIPMSGQGTRYRKAGYTEPKPLIPVNGRPMISRLLDNFPLQWPTHFVLAENHRNTELPVVLKKDRPAATLQFIPEHSKGPSFAALAALDELDACLPVLVSYCDYAMVWDPAQFARFVSSTNCDACVISYRGYHAHYRGPQKYAYSRMEGERVVEVREKGSFTDTRENEFASSGGYYFRSVALLRRAIEHQIKIDLSLGGEFYTSLTVEALLRSNSDAHVRVFEIPGFFQWGTPEDLQISEYWEKSFEAYERRAGETRAYVAQVLMPMAGLGSRFTGITSLPKAIIPVNGTPMYQSALASLPKAGRTVLVTVKELAQNLPSSGPQVISLEKTPPGQALSTEAGVSALDAQQEVMVTSCDHAIVLSSSSWERFHANPDCDAAIFTMRGYPGAKAKPNSYAYVVPEGKGEFPLVSRVSVKQPVSDDPMGDHVLVGTFWFKTAKLLGDGIAALKRQEVLVNGEMYLDSVFEVLQKSGHTIRMVPLDGYICWGDPESLSEALYWQELCGGYRIDKRAKFPGVEETRT